MPVGAAYRSRLGARRARARPRRRSSPPRRGGARNRRPGPQPAAERRLVGQPPEREDREVTGRHDVRVVPRSPELDERWILPRRRLGPLDARMDREERGSGHAVLQAGPCCPPERRRPRGSRSSSAPTCRRNARICGLVRRSREVVTVPPDPGAHAVSVKKPTGTPVDALPRSLGIDRTSGDPLSHRASQGRA